MDRTDAGRFSAHVDEGVISGRSPKKPKYQQQALQNGGAVASLTKQTVYPSANSKTMRPHRKVETSASCQRTPLHHRPSVACLAKPKHATARVRHALEKGRLRGRGWPSDFYSGQIDTKSWIKTFAQDVSASWLMRQTINRFVLCKTRDHKCRQSDCAQRSVSGRHHGGQATGRVL